MAKIRMLKYTTVLDKVTMLLGLACAVWSGLALPVYVVYLGRVVDFLISHRRSVTDVRSISNDSAVNETNLEETQHNMWGFTGVFLAEALTFAVTSYVALVSWIWCATRAITRLRKEFFRTILAQKVGWFDVNDPEELRNIFFQNTEYIAGVIGDNVPLFMQWLVTCIASYVVAFAYGWRMGVPLFFFCSMIIGANLILNKRIRRMDVEQFDFTTSMTSAALAVYRNVREVQAYGTEEEEAEKFYVLNKDEEHIAEAMAIALSLLSSITWSGLFVAFAMTFGLCMYLVHSYGLSPGNIIPVFLGCLVGVLSITQIMPGIWSVSDYTRGVGNVFGVLESCSTADPWADEGEIPPSVASGVSFRNVYFRYPTALKPIFRNLKFKITLGETVAIVGDRNSGKSTILKLIQRFYNPSIGAIKLNKTNINKLNRRWLRNITGVVDQRPVLFPTLTIGNNIRHGRLDVTLDVVRRAARLANADNFIMELSRGYDTFPYELDCQLDEGEIKRIAIARALVTKPKLLLLDEVMEGLSPDSQAIIRKWLELKADRTRTTIITTHDPATLCKVDRVFVLHHGQVVESGPPDLLLPLERYYCQILKQGTSKTEVRDTENFQGPISSRHMFQGRISARRRAFKHISLSTSRSSEIQDFLMMESFTESHKRATARQMLRLVEMSRGSWGLICGACIMAVLVGLVPALFAFVLGHYMEIFLNKSQTEQVMMTLFIAGFSVCIAVSYPLCKTTLKYCFAISGSRLTSLLRKTVLEAMLKREIIFFDVHTQSIEHLTEKLLLDTEIATELVGSTFGDCLEVSCTIVATLVLAFCFEWRMVVAFLSFVPLIGGLAYAEFRARLAALASRIEQLVPAAQVFREAIDKISTTNTYALENIFIERMDYILDNCRKEQTRYAHFVALTHAGTMSVIFLAYVMSFAFGAHRLLEKESNMEHIVIAFSCLMIGAFTVVANADLETRSKEISRAVGWLFGVIDMKYSISVNNPGRVMEYLHCDVTLDSATFRYPFQTGRYVLNNVNFSIKSGSTLAVIGPAGSGKSTLLYLLERFYDLDWGALCIDGADIETLDLKWWRSQLALVTSSPTIFQGTVTYNIAYSKLTPMSSMEPVTAAAMMAGAHQFIEGLPQGYATELGPKGGYPLSKSQTVRIALARALFRDPKLLLIDDCLSEVDSDVEDLQEALLRARKGRTCVVVSRHRSQLQTADKIMVLGLGKVLETGNHEELMAMRGIYYVTYHPKFVAARMWRSAVNKLRKASLSRNLGLVIWDTPMGSDDSPRPSLYESTSVLEHIRDTTWAERRQTSNSIFRQPSNSIFISHV